MARLETQNLSLGYGTQEIVHQVSLRFDEGKVNMLIGANASGKSTLLSGLIDIVKPMSGKVLLDGTELSAIPPKDRAKRLGLLPQHPIAPEGITVWDLVARGRYPHQKWFQQFSSTDEQAVCQALLKTNTIDLAQNTMQELSGGQQQRVWVAMALAQEAEVLLLDEPTSYLDMKHQLDILSAIRELNQQHGITIIMVIHELNFALRFADKLIAMRAGEVYAEGAPEDIIDAQLIKDVFDLDAQIHTDPVQGTPMVVPL